MYQYRYQWFIYYLNKSSTVNFVCTLTIWYLEVDTVTIVRKIDLIILVPVAPVVHTWDIFYCKYTVVYRKWPTFWYREIALAGVDISSSLAARMSSWAAASGEPACRYSRPPRDARLSTWQYISFHSYGTVRKANIKGTVSRDRGQDEPMEQ
jgi:hypothetical protein